MTNPRHRLSTIDDADANRAENEKPPNDRGFRDESKLLTITDNQQQAERGGFEPPVGLKPYTDLANRRIRPLCHLSDPLTDGRKYSGLDLESNVRSNYARSTFSPLRDGCRGPNST